MQKLHIDIETFSTVNLKTAGLYKYAENCEVILFAYSYGDNPVNVYDLTKEDLPDELLQDLQDPDILKIAHNAAFERTCIANYFDINCPPEQWYCSMVLCAIAGLPLSLDQASKVLNLSDQKDASGKALIRFFTVPSKPSKLSPGERRLPKQYPDKWKAFVEYCRQDVVTERAVTEALSFIRLTPNEKKLWNLDQRINDAGVKINLQLARNAVKMDADYRKRLIAEAIEISKIENPNSVQQVIKWLNTETGENISNLKKAEIPDLIKRFDSKKAKRILEIRQELSKTSVKKYVAMLNAACKDGRLRGLMQFYGAGRTGRWGGRGTQPHNLPKGHFSDIPRLNEILMQGARDLVLKGDAESIEMIFGAIPDLLSKLLRTAFEATSGFKFPVSDFSAIEARVIAWLANERWRLDIFNGHGKIYEASAAQMFKVPIEAVTKTSEYRAKGKIAELALGYQGGVNALIVMQSTDKDIQEGKKQPIPESELKPIVDAWRSANPNIKKFWHDVDKAAKLAIRAGGRVEMPKGITFQYKNGNLLIGLPSGRVLCYYRASLTSGDYGDVIQYWGVAGDQAKKWSRIKTYGGKITENIVQAVARDCLAQALINLDDAGYKTVIHVHDEIVCEVDENEIDLDEMNALMIKPATWMQGLPLRADGFITDYYKKD